MVEGLAIHKIRPSLMVDGSIQTTQFQIELDGANAFLQVQYHNRMAQTVIQTRDHAEIAVTLKSFMADNDLQYALIANPQIVPY